MRWQVPALERWTNLESLTLDHCGLLTHLTLSLPRLRNISLRHCRALATVRHPAALPLLALPLQYNSRAQIVGHSKFLTRTSVFFTC